MGQWLPVWWGRKSRSTTFGATPSTWRPGWTAVASWDASRYFFVNNKNFKSPNSWVFAKGDGRHSENPDGLWLRVWMPWTNLRQRQGQTVHLLCENAIRQRQVVARHQNAVEQYTNARKTRDFVFLGGENSMKLFCRNKMSCCRVSCKNETCLV